MVKQELAILCSDSSAQLRPAERNHSTSAKYVCGTSYISHEIYISAVGAVDRAKERRHPRPRLHSRKSRVPAE